MDPCRDAPVSEAAVAERLEGLRALHRLGLSLAAAQGPAISEELFQRRSICLEALLPRCDRAGVAGRPAGIQDIWVACGRAGTRHEVGREFDLLLPAAEGAPALVRCVLVGVALDSGERGDALPAGRRAACCFRFFGEVPDPVRSLPAGGGALPGPGVWLGTEADWRKLRPRGAATRAE